MNADLHLTYRGSKHVVSVDEGQDVHRQCAKAFGVDVKSLKLVSRGKQYVWKLSPLDRAEVLRRSSEGALILAISSSVADLPAAPPPPPAAWRTALASGLSAGAVVRFGQRLLRAAWLFVYSMFAVPPRGECAGR